MKHLFLLGMVAYLIATTKGPVDNSRIWDTKLHDINQVELEITNYGQFGPAWWPKGSDHNFVYGAGLWFGAIDEATYDTLVTIGYGPHGGETEFVPGLYGQNPNAPYVMIYMYPDDWPAPTDSFPMAPQEPVSHQDSWCCYNDCDSNYHIPGDTRPIGIEVYQTVYAWDVPEIEDIIFFTYEVKNVSDNNLKDCYFGICADCDIGNEAGSNANDRMAGIVGQWYVVDAESIWVDNLGYQWQEESEPGWAQFPGTIGFDLLKTPFDIGMTAFKRFALDLEPNIDSERYMTLAGYNFKTGEYEPFDTLPSGPDDQRFLMSSGPFDLAPGSSVIIVFAVLFAEWYDIYETPDTALVLVDKWAQYQYDNDWILSVENIPSHECIKTDLAVSPNPIIRNAKVSFVLQKSGIVALKLYNIAGQLVKEIFEEQKSAGSYTIDLSTRDLAQGTYFLVLETSDNKTSRSLVILR